MFSYIDTPAEYILISNYQDLFSQLFGGGGFFGGGPSRQQGPRKSKDLLHRVNVTLEELYKGKTTKLALTRNVICSKCAGKGGKEGAVRSCAACQGRGIRVTLRQMGPMIQQIQQPCDECSGSGEVINHKDKCKVCNGKKTVSEKKMLEVHIDKGMKGGQTITFRGESDQAPGVTPGDVVIVVEEKPHDRFQRKENDLFTAVEIDLLTALGGGQFAIRHLDDRALVVTILPGEVIKHGEPCGFTLMIYNFNVPSQMISRSFTARECHPNDTTSREIFMSRYPSSSQKPLTLHLSLYWNECCHHANLSRPSPKQFFLKKLI
jgi:DnaJ family protein A protein 2